MTGNDYVSFSELLDTEPIFFQYAKPLQSYTSEEIISTHCCEEYCNLRITRSDILKCRLLYVRHAQQSKSCGKEDTRQSFINSLTRVHENEIHLVSILDGMQLCKLIISRIFGISLATFMNYLTDRETTRPLLREPYKKTIERLGETLYNLSQHVQPNSLGQVMLEPQFSKRVLSSSSRPVDLAEIRDVTGLKIRERKNDSLTRCTSCVFLSQKSKTAPTDTDKAEAKRMYNNHLKIVKQQRVIVDALNRKSRDETDDSVCIALDAMSNRISKLPIMKKRPKCITDADMVAITITGVQIAQNTGASQYRNIDYTLLTGVFKHDSSYNLSLIVDAIKKLSSLPSKLTIIADNAPNNKSFVMLAGLGYLLLKIKHLNQVRLLYGLVGHTHNSVDAHFGNIANALKGKDLLDPKKFTEAIKKMPSVSEVVSAPTVYSFEELSNAVHRPVHLLSNNQVLLTKDSENVYWSAASTMNSTELFEIDPDECSFKLFKEDYNLDSFVPKILAPTRDGVEDKVDRLFKVGNAFFSDDNRKEFDNLFEVYGKEAFGNTLRLINKIPAKVNRGDSDVNYDEMHRTVLEYLEKNKVNTGRTPKTPTVTTGMRRKV